MSGALQAVFSNKALRTWLFRTRFLLAALALLPVARLGHLERLPLAIALSLLGQVIQGWCFGALVKNRELSIRGPYVLVRNPMYLGRYLLILGFVILLDGVWATAAYTALYFPYMLFRVRREENRLRRMYHERFEDYCRSVNRFWPTWRRLGEPSLRFFDARMFYDNNGHWNVLLTLAAYVAIGVLRGV